MPKLRLPFVVLLLLCAPGGVAAIDYYASPSGRPSGNGSIGNPWDLQTALSQPPSVHPGDTIWLRGGTYSGIYSSFLTGTASAPIIVRQVPGERATLDGGTANTAVLLTVWGAYTWFWGFEVMSSSLDRFSNDPSSYPTDLNRPYEGIANAQQPGSGVGTKFINLVVHDLGQGFGFWQDATDAEINGCLIYYNGWDAPDRGHGHGIYTQNQTGTKTIKDNIIFANFSHGIHAYGSGSAHLNNIWAEGNILFQSGVLSAVEGGRNLLIGGESGNVAQSPTVASNFLYRSSGGVTNSSDFDLGYSGGCANPRVTNNYIADNTQFVNCSDITMTGNTFYGAIGGFSPASFPSNTYFSQRPTGTLVFVRPNQYEPGRANIAVYNWDNQPTVSVDVSSVLAPGASFEIRNAQNFFGPPVLSGIYSGANLIVPMTGLAPALPYGVSAPSLTGPTFNAFVLFQTASAPVSSAFFYTLSPCRLVDTRTASGPFGGPSLVDHSSRTFTLTGRCGIPSTAKAVAINVVSISATAGPGFLTIYPGGFLRPTTSTINYKPRQTRANSALMALGPNGDLTVYCQQGAGTVDLVIDVSGYFQ